MLLRALLPLLPLPLPLLLPLLPLMLLWCGDCCCVWLLRLYSLSVSGVRFCRCKRCKLKPSWSPQERRV